MQAKLPISGELAQRGGSLGRVELAPCGLVASGVVVDEAGAPVERVAVALEYTESWKTRMRERLHGAWSDARLDEWVARCDDEGRFELLGDPGEGEFALRPRSSESIDPELVPIELGATDVRIVLRSWACMVAHVELDSGIPSNVVWALARLPTLGSSEVQTSSWPDAHGDLVWRKLVPGRASVVLWPANCVGAGREPLFRAADVVVESGRCTRDPRLASIDLRGRFVRSRIEVVDADGAPVPEGEIEEIAAPDANANTVQFERGAFDLCSMGTWPEAIVRSPGFRSTRVALRAPLTRVVLRGAIRLRIEPSGDAPALPPDRELRLTLVRLVGDSEQDERSARLDGKPIEVVLGDSGRYRMKVTVVVHRDSGSSSIDVDSLTKEFDVVDSDEQVVALPLEGAPILAASKELGGS
jgi:hypothetical protein